MFPNFEPPVQYRDAAEPGVAAKIDAVLAAEPPRPEIGEAHDDIVQFPGGFTYGDVVVRHGRVRELTGADEEELARTTTTEGLINTLLTRGVISLGELVQNPAHLLDGLLIGDRDALILGIRRVCFGNHIEFEKFVCPSCASEFQVSFDLDDIPTVRSTTPGEMNILVDLRGGRRAKVRLATGYDQAALLESDRKGKTNAAEQDTLLLSRTVLAIINPDGTEYEIGANKDVVRNLTLADRRAIMRASQARRPGPRMNEAKIVCPDCAAETEVPITVDLLFRG